MTGSPTGWVLIGVDEVGGVNGVGSGVGVGAGTEIVTLTR